MSALERAYRRQRASAPVGGGAVVLRGRHSILLRKLGSQRVKEDARSSGGRWVAVAAHWQMLARGGTRRRGGVGARVGYRPGVGALTVIGQRLSALCARPMVFNRGEATATGGSNTDPLL